tara:strand:+ start:15 stop:896 length:882 start_codon:yes stop_codon:yes gene_type:complete
MDKTPDDSLNNLSRHLAIQELKGNSIGFLRTYPQNIKSGFIGYFYDHYYFVWGEDSNNKMNKTKNYINNIVTSGYPYFELKNNFKSYNSFKRNDNFFNILLMDTNHSLNNEKIKLSTKHNFQFYYRKDIENFYNKFLDLLAKNKKYRLIIKPKKYNEFIKLQNIIKKLRNNLDIKNRILIIKEQNVRPIQLKEFVDISIVTSVYFPTAVIECIAADMKTIFYDLYNVCNNENYLIKLIKKNNIYNQLDMLINDIINNREIGLSNNELIDKTIAKELNYKELITNEIVKLIDNR